MLIKNKTKSVVESYCLNNGKIFFFANGFWQHLILKLSGILNKTFHAKSFKLQWLYCKYFYYYEILVSFMLWRLQEQNFIARLLAGRLLTSLVSFRSRLACHHHLNFALGPCLDCKSRQKCSLFAFMLVEVYYKKL